ncbi:MAG: hypothetical protein U1F19_03035 [Lysobacterales bacterium]
MDGMALPIRLGAEAGQPMLVPATVDVAVNLHDPDARGILMSRVFAAAAKTGQRKPGRTIAAASAGSVHRQPKRRGHSRTLASALRSVAAAQGVIER